MRRQRRRRLARSGDWCAVSGDWCAVSGDWCAVSSAPATGAPSVATGAPSAAPATGAPSVATGAPSAAPATGAPSAATGAPSVATGAPSAAPATGAPSAATTKQMPCQRSMGFDVHPDDFGNVVKLKQEGKTLEATIIATALSQRWKPATKTDFPTSEHKRAGKLRTLRANDSHLSAFPWLGISRHADNWGAWCVPCALFATSEAGGRAGAANQRLGNLVVRPLRNFSDLTGSDGAFSRHSRLDYHRSALATAADFLRTWNNRDLSVSQVLVSASRREVERTRAGLVSIVDALKFAALQNIPLRGHRDDGRIDPTGQYPDTNDGNFRMLLRFRLQGGDKALEEHLKSASSAALYTSKTTQNELLTDMLRLLQDAVSAKVAASPLWAVIVDETTDLARREQLVVAVRYIDVKNGKHVLCEDPITMVDVFEQLNAVNDNSEVKLSGENLAKVILDVLDRLRLDKKHLIAQCYDGAAAMSSMKVGVAARVQEVAPLAHYYHCAMHGLNLAASKMSSVRAVKNAQGTMETVIVFVSDSAKRAVVLKQAQKKTGQSQQRLIKLCETRFVERYNSVHRFCEQFAAIVDALRLMSDWTDAVTSAKASMLLKAMTASDFLVAIVVMKSLASLLRPVSIRLQKQGADLVQALDLVQATISALTDLRTESAFDPVIAEAQAMAEELGTTIDKPRIPAHRSTFRANAGENLDAAGHYRINVFLPAIDAVQQDMEERFGSDRPSSGSAGQTTKEQRRAHQRKVFALSGILPRRVADSKWEDIRPAWLLYRPILPDGDEGDVTAEFLVWSAMWRRCQDVLPESAVAALDQCDLATFPTIFRLLQVCIIVFLPPSPDPQLPVIIRSCALCFAVCCIVMTNINNSLLVNKVGGDFSAHCHTEP